MAEGFPILQNSGRLLEARRLSLLDRREQELLLYVVSNQIPNLLGLSTGEEVVTADELTGKITKRKIHAFACIFRGGSGPFVDPFVLSAFCTDCDDPGYRSPWLSLRLTRKL